MVKIASSLLCVLGGGTLRCEAPIIQISSGTFIVVGQCAGSVFKRYEAHSWIMAGSAVGLAAAFDAPITGLIFILEKFKPSYGLRQLTIFIIKTICAIAVGVILIPYFKNFSISLDIGNYSMIWKWDMIYRLLILILSCGILTWVMQSVVKCATRSLSAIVSGRNWYLVPIIAGIIVGTINACIDVPQVGAGLFLIKDAMLNEGTFTLYQSVGRFFSIIATAISGCAGGLFLPSLTMGASIGYLIGGLDQHFFMMIGMAAFLGAMFYSPLTATALVLEMTLNIHGDYRYLLLLYLHH